MSQYVMQQVHQIVKNLIDGVGMQQDPQLYNTILGNISNPNSDLSQHFTNHLNRVTQGRWTNGISPNDLVNIVRPWLNDAIVHIQKQIRPMQMQSPNYGGGYQQPQQQSYGGFNNNFLAQNTVNPTASLFDSGTPSQPISVQQPQQSQTVQYTAAERISPMDGFDLGRSVAFELHDASTLQHHPKEGNLVRLDNYQEGSFEDIRISTIDIILNTTENNSKEAADKAVKYSPNEVLRGIYANVVEYKELFYIPIGMDHFKRISEVITKDFYGESRRQKPEWRNALRAMGTLNIAEYKIIETALLKFLNPSIFKFLRTSSGDVIESIEFVEDLHELDDPKSKLKVTQHTAYMNIFNELVTRAFDTLFNPELLIGPDDKNFGDFIHCDKIEFWHDERSKYDYGTYTDKADKIKFIDMMTAKHTVLRIVKTSIITNSIDERVANNITHFRARDSVPLLSTNNVGCKLLLGLDQPKRSEIERVVCIGDDNALSNRTHLVNLGRTLDNQLVLIR